MSPELDTPLRILTVCTGNICRSPLAELLVDRVAMTHAVEVEVRSGGTLGLVDRPSPRQLVAVAREIGVDLSAHRSKPVTAEQAAWADHILVMELQHAQHIREQFTEVDPDKIVLLGAFVGKQEIDDPMGAWFKGPYRRMQDEVHTAIQRFFDSLERR